MKAPKGLMPGYYVQVGYGEKGSYKTKYSFLPLVRRQATAFRWYSGVNVHSGYKKRIIYVTDNREMILLHRVLT